MKNFEKFELENLYDIKGGNGIEDTSNDNVDPDPETPPSETTYPVSFGSKTGKNPL